MEEIVPLAPEREERNRRVGASIKGWLDAQNISQAVAARVCDVSGKTFGTWVRGTAGAELAALVDLAAFLGISVAQLIGEDATPPAPDRPPVSLKAPRFAEFDVPIFDIRVSAGPGIELLGEQPIGHMGFPVAMLRNLGTPEAMALLQLDGDSMWPELTSGQLIMVDLSQREPREGITVARFDQQLLCKRLRLTGAGTAELFSLNTAYPPIPVELDSDRFEVIGRPVWSGGKLG